MSSIKADSLPFQIYIIIEETSGTSTIIAARYKLVHAAALLADYLDIRFRAGFSELQVLDAAKSGKPISWSKFNYTIQAITIL